MRKILYFVSEDWFFCSHFLPLARAARAAGFDVTIATRVRDSGEAITGEGFRLIPFEADRGSYGSAEIVRTLARATRLIARERPDILHCIALRSVVLAGTAGRLAGAKALVLAPTGLGHLWIEDSPLIRMLRAATRYAVRRLARGKAQFIFENPDDLRELGLEHLTKGRVTFVGGAGVNPERFTPAAEPPAPPLKIAVVARMIAPKGIRESVEAVRIARSRGTAVELHLFGAPDPLNKRSIDAAQLVEWAREPGIHWHGSTTDIAAVWRDHHVAQLLSRREGTPRSLVEAAACGRPVIATDVPGCREIVRDGTTGYLVPLGDVDATAEAIRRLAGDPALRQRFGNAGRKLFEQRFTEAAVTSRILDVYQTMLAADRSPKPK